MKTVALYNVKGGVGKTAAAVNLAHLAASEGRRTLLWDLDPQGAASWYLEVEREAKARTRKLVRGRYSLAAQAQASVHPRLDVVPADISYRDLDLLVTEEKKSRDVLRRLIAPLDAEYQLLVLDCPPSFSRLSENVFAAADMILVPLIPTPLSVRAFEQLVAFFRSEDLPLTRLHPFFSMVDRRRSLHRAWLTQPPTSLGNLLGAYLPYATAVEQMGSHQAPVAAFAPNSPAASAYRALWQEILTRL